MFHPSLFYLLGSFTLNFFPPFFYVRFATVQLSFPLLSIVVAYYHLFWFFPLFWNIPAHPFLRTFPSPFPSLICNTFNSPPLSHHLIHTHIHTIIHSFVISSLNYVYAYHFFPYHLHRHVMSCDEPASPLVDYVTLHDYERGVLLVREGKSEESHMDTRTSVHWTLDTEHFETQLFLPSPLSRHNPITPHRKFEIHISKMHNSLCGGAHGWWWVLGLSLPFSIFLGIFLLIFCFRTSLAELRWERISWYNPLFLGLVWLAQIRVASRCNSSFPHCSRLDFLSNYIWT